ncbi:MAG: TrmB family transcriptional regulator [Candidatus Aenigmarchaeota archaeon]|nr:TrmB family transcriptional regulator [Candidatus Aenigmarchaeota archaeon]
MVLASSKTMDALRAIGLNKYQRNLWAALLSRGASTAGELSDISNVPRSRCYDVLQSLADLGFVIVQPGKPMRYVAVAPHEAFDRAKKRIREMTEERVHKIDRMKNSDIIRELQKLHKGSMKVVQPEELSGSIKGRYALHQHLESMMKRSKKHVKMLLTPNMLNETAENKMLLFKRLSENGVKIKILAPIEKNTGEQAKLLAKYADVRDVSSIENVDKILGHCVIVDGNEFLMGLTDDAKTHPTQDIAFWTQSSHASSRFLEPVYDMVWKQAKPVK